MPSQTVGLLGAPYDGSSSYARGAAAGPDAIRAALRSPSTNLYSERGIDVRDTRALQDLGDVAVSAGATGRAAIERGVASLIDRSFKPLTLGGDHSITYSTVRAVRQHHRPLSLLYIDAHPDLYPEFEGDRYSHACPCARILEEGLVDQLVQVGIRTMNAVQQREADRHGVEVIDMRAWTAGSTVHLRHPVYVSIDLDGLDPAYAPGVSHLEPGGLSVRDVIGILHSLAVPVVGADIVELNPSRDVRDMTARVAAKFVKELVEVMVR